MDIGGTPDGTPARRKTVMEKVVGKFKKQQKDQRGQREPGAEARRFGQQDSQQPG